MAISSIEQLESFRSRWPAQKLTLAAEELHVTPGAVSRQIKALEEKLGGSPLCSRSPSSLRFGSRLRKAQQWRGKSIDLRGRAHHDLGFQIMANSAGSEIPGVDRQSPANGPRTTRSDGEKPGMQNGFH